MKLKNPILFLTSLLPLCFLAGCEYGPKRPETKHLTINFKNMIDGSSGEKCFYSDTSDYFWFTYENLSDYSSVDGFSRFEEHGYFQNKTAFDSIVKIKITFGESTSRVPIHYGIYRDSFLVDSYFNDTIINSVYEFDFFSYYRRSYYDPDSYIYPSYFIIDNNQIDYQTNTILPFDIKTIDIDYVDIDNKHMRGCDFTYDEKTGGVTLSHCNDRTTSFSIPSKVGKLSVTGIGEECFKDYSHLEHITIPKTVKTIGKSAFQGLRQLKTVDFEEGSVLETIEDNAFASCVRIDHITFPASLRSVSQNAFTTGRTIYYYQEDDGFWATTKLFFKGNNTAAWSDDKNLYGDLDNFTVSYFNCNDDNLVWVDGIAYYNFYGKVYVVDVNDDIKDIKIKSIVSFNGKTRSVCGIKNYAFANTDPTNIEIGTTIREIEKDAFTNGREYKNLKFTTFKNGKYIGNPANPYMIFVTCIDNKQKIVFNDKTEIVLTEGFLGSGYYYEMPFKESANDVDGVYYIPSETNPYFACYEVTSSYEHPNPELYNTLIINDRTRVLFPHFNSYKDRVHLPNDLIYVAPEALYDYGGYQIYDISSSNPYFETVKGSVYDVYGETSTLLHLSFGYDYDGHSSEPESISVANGTTHIGRDSINGRRKILLLPESLLAIDDNCNDNYHDQFFDAVNIPANLQYVGNLFRWFNKTDLVLVSSESRYFKKNSHNEIVSFDGSTLYLGHCDDQLNTIVSPEIKNITKYSLHARNCYISKNVETIERNALDGKMSYSSNMFAILEEDEKPGFAKGWDSGCAYVSRNNSFVKDKDGVIYTLNENGEAIAMSYWKTDIDSIKGNVNINGKNYPVVEIGRDCFMGENFPKATFTTSRIVIPSTVKKISLHAFVWFEYKNYSEDNYVFIPNSVESIPDQAFHGSGNIHCQAISKPEGWSDGWQYGSEVTFGCSE